MQFPCYENQETCERCHKPLDKDKAVWLELNSHTDMYSLPGTVPENESQGCFTFGPDCAKVVLENPDTWEYIGLAKKNRGE